MSSVSLISPGVWRLELPSRTLPPFKNTNSYLIQDGGVGVLLDPGFHAPESLLTLKELLAREGVGFLKAVLLTHTHQDHIEGLALVQAAFPDLPVYVHPNEHARLEARNIRALNGERTLTVGNRTLRSVFTPGHSPGHLSFYLEDAGLALVGDVAAGQGSTWVGVPEGDVDDFLASIDSLRALKVKVLGPGHGPPIDDPYTRLNDLRAHRLARLEQVCRALEEGALDLAQLRAAVYPEVPDALGDLAERSLLALLKKLMRDLRVLHLGEDESGPYALRR